ncbi:RNA polymerase sigma-70 factor, ECF subfamily [Mariprofundus micogutta]|uniref:RNA polymerase sigma factor SigZ n=1 Tax=Mariprofundus micogutta TaxID=1921010 RepID=A0A1L8CMR8_9PROT|nr:RNA polymerase sigma factor SigZ [Mariprofundus micogutta]GAV20139.1 RNA polymerase sigma-70 factor, ECF subfamily [Mariprofundus micogutta]
MSQSDHGCLIRAWHQHSGELRSWLLKRVEDTTEAEDLLQEVFFKALLQKERFCRVENARAWLFRVTSNAVIDRYRLRKDHVPLPDDIVQHEEVGVAVDDLSQCIPRVLSELSQPDREAITLCDLDGMSQQRYAEMKGITLAAAKSRVQRARKRLRQTLEINCKVQLNDAGNVCCFVPR